MQWSVRFKCVRLDELNSTGHGGLGFIRLDRVRLTRSHHASCSI